MKIIKLSAGDIDLEREREKPQIWNVRNEKRITTDPTATKKPTNK